MNLLDLFVAASMPVLKVLLVTALGSFLAMDHVNILGDDATKHLNNIVFFVFNPALVAANLSKTITDESLVKLWFMPLNILITFIIGSALGWIVNLLTRPPQHLRGLIVGCCAAGNLGNMLFIIIPAVCKEKGSPFGASNECDKYGMAYASLSMAVGAIYLWSYVYNIVRVSSRKSGSSISTPCKEVSISPRANCKEPLLSSTDLEINVDEKPEVPISKKIKQRFKILSEHLNLKALFAPSTIGAIVGFVIGLVPPIRNLLIGENAPLRVIQDSTSLLGDGAIPALTLIIGGNLLRGLRGSAIHKSLVVGIVVARYVILPLLGIFVIKGAVRFGLVPSNPLYQFVLLLQYAVPPAMNIGTITQLFGAGESECSVIMLWTYALASISLTFWSTLFMWLVA